MQSDMSESPRKVGFRQGLVLLLASVALSPMVFVLEGLIPSRENTTLDELPSLLVTVAIVGLAVAGVARIAYALIAERRRTRLGESSATTPLAHPPQTNLATEYRTDHARELRSTHETPE